MKMFKKILVLVVLFFSVAMIAPVVYASVTPSLTLTSTGSGDGVQINVNGDPSVSVLFFYTSSGSGSQMTSLGTTNSSGSFSTTVSSATYGITSNTIVYVKTGGINGLQSPNVSWPYQTSATTGTLTLSQSAVLLNAGQTSSVTASASYLYLFSNSNPSIANLNFNASQITVQALTYGSTIAKVCVLGSTTNCATINITVQNSNVQQLSFSQNNFSIISGQSSSVTATGGTGSYTISNNSNPTAVQATLSNSAVILTATSTTGSASITVCTTDMSSCGIINVSSTAANSSAVTFSQTNPVVAIGQSTTVTIYGTSGTNFYVSSNSNPSIVQANINSNILTLIGNATGTSNINICAYGGTCASLTANVSTVANSGGLIALSQSSVSILEGQSANITISGGSTPYNFSPNSGSSNIFSGNINGNTLTIYGVNTGSGTASICCSAGCTTLAITVNSLTTSTTNVPPTFSQNNILLTAGNQTTVYLSGNGSYYISNNSSSNTASAVISGSSAVISGINAGTDSISICQTGGQCANLYVTVNGVTTQNLSVTLSPSSQSVAVGGVARFVVSASNFVNPSYSLNDSFAGTSITNSDIALGAFVWTPVQGDIGSHNITVLVSDLYGHSASAAAQIAVSQQTVTSSPTTTTTPAFLARYLGYGDIGQDVLALQKYLAKEGFLSTAPTGRFGPATVTAIKKFQKEHSIKQAGTVGPSTMEILNKLVSPSSSVSTTLQQQVENQIKQLQAQIKAMQ